MANGPIRRHSQTTHAAKLRWNAAKAIESRWNKNCFSLLTEEIDTILWPELSRNSTAADSLIYYYYYYFVGVNIKEKC